MEIEKLKKYKEGDTINIKGENFEIIKIESGAESDDKRDPSIREYLSFELHGIKDKSLFPGFELRIYKDNKEIKFFELNYEKPKFPKWFKPRRRGGWVGYKEIKIKI